MNEPLFFADMSLQILLDALPASVWVVDRDVRILAVNRTGSELLARGREALVLDLAGNALGCVNAQEDACGKGPACDRCLLRGMAEAALAGASMPARLLRMTLMRKGEPCQESFLVSAAPFHYRGRALALILVQPMDNDDAAEEIIAVCPNCQSVRDGGEWVSSGDFLLRRHRKNITHAFCRDCLDRLYPGQGGGQRGEG